MWAMSKEIKASQNTVHCLSVAAAKELFFHPKSVHVFHISYFCMKIMLWVHIRIASTRPSKEYPQPMFFVEKQEKYVSLYFSYRELCSS